MIRSMGMFKSSSTNNKTKIQCKKHPKHRQSPGVCSLCLAQKLSKLSSFDNNNNNNRYALTYKAKARAYYYCSSSSVSSSADDEDEDDYDDYYYNDNSDNVYDYEDDLSSSTSSPELSPVRGHHRRIVSDVNNKYFVNDNDTRLNHFDKSSKLMAVGCNNNKSGTIRSKNKEKKRVFATDNIIGFWSKLVGTSKSWRHVNHAEMIYRSQPLATASRDMRLHIYA